MTQKSAFASGKRVDSVAAPAAVEPKAGKSGRECSLEATEENVADRKLRLLRRAGLFGEDTKGAVIERACTLDDLRAAYRLVHDVYLGTGFICPEPSGLRLRIFETSSDTATFVAKVKGKVVGVLSIVGDSSDLGLPSDAAFKDELDQRRAQKSRLCEITNQAVAEEYRKSAVPTELMRCAITHAFNTGYDEGVATVSPSHNGFYDLLGFRQLGSERSYSQKLHDPVVALTMDIRHHFRVRAMTNETERFLHHFMVGGNRFFNRVAVWANVAKRNFLNPLFLQQLFVTQSNFLAACTARELAILRRRWGQEMFEAVMAGDFSATDPSSPTCQSSVGSETPFLHSAPEVFENFGGRLQRFATAARDQVAHPLLDLWSWSDAPFEGRTGENRSRVRDAVNLSRASAVSY